MPPKEDYDDDEDEEQEQQLVIPKYKLLYQDLEVVLKPLNLDDENKEAEEEEKKEEANVDESAKDKKKPMEKIITYVAEILAENTEEKKLSDKEIAQKLKVKLDEDNDLNQPSVSNEDIEEHGVWQVCVGKQFAASVTFDAKYIYYFQLEESRKYFLVFRS
jgi:hypothetical protein